MDEVSVYRARQEGMLLRDRKRFTVIDLFAGAGGISLGFGEAFGHSFRPIWANDFDADAVRTYRTNFGDHCLHGDIRELRVELGYQIASGASPDPATGIDLKPDEYLLVVAAPDVDAARRWHVANRIRKSPGGSRGRVLQYLKENVGKVVTTEELAYVAKNAKEFARRVRELRTEEGFAIATRFTGRPDLAVGQYVLESVERIAEPHDRKIPLDVQGVVYARDKNACRLCGWNHAHLRPDSPRILELHHLKQHADGGQNSPANLIVICSRCHDDVHAGRQTPPMTEG